MKTNTALHSFLIKSAGVTLASLIATQALAGWSVSGTQVLDPNGKNFIFRGINHAHTWYADKTPQAISDIAATGANSVRVVLANGTQWTRNSGAELASIIAQCKAANLVCVLEVHDSTGFGENAAATNISNAASYWASSDIKNAIIGQEDFVIINIANEPYGNGVNASTYTSETSAAIKTIRNAGLTHLIMVDAPNWGQDWSHIMRDNAATIFAADAQSNTVFSVHMYEVYTSATAVQDYLTTFKAKGFALVVGEFASENNGKSVDAVSILKYSQEMGIGYIGWSWSGNSSSLIALDITNNWNAASLSNWGNLLINGANGIKATSKLATNFTGGAVSSKAASSKTTSSTTNSAAKSSAASSVAVATGEYCNWYNNPYPLCANTASGWGYENNTSCVGRISCAALPSPLGIVGGATSSKANASLKASSANTILSSSSKSSAARSIASSSASSVATAAGLSCSYVVTNSWNGGFTGAIRITNKGTVAVSGWAANWKYSGTNRITSTWNATLSGSNPYTAINVNYNGSLGVGQTTEFGFQANSNGGGIEIPAVNCK